jgi:hypothetical protein
LHQSTVDQWDRATTDNRLATAADFAAAVLGGRFGSMDALKTHAQEMERCVSEAVKDLKSSNERISTIAAACAVLMGWNKQA